MSDNFIVNSDNFDRHYPDQSFILHHRLADHPLLQFPRLLGLEKVLPDKKINYYTGKVGVNDDKTITPPTGLTSEETIRRIEKAESWLVLKNIELDPDYRAMVEELLEELGQWVMRKNSSRRQFEGWIFITSPQSISPFHIDPEHNFLLQIRGKKTVHVFNQFDREILSEKYLEKYYTEGSANAKLEYTEEMQKKAMTFDIKPGEGVFIPLTAPHWVKVEDNVSISLSVTFYCDEADRKARLYRFNSRLRRFGMTPTPYRTSAFRDATKEAVISTYLKTRQLLGRAPDQTTSRY